MKVALVGLPGAGKTTLFNAIADQPVELLPGVAGSPPHMAALKVRDERLEWLRDHYEPKKYTPATLTVEDYPGIPPGAARIDRRRELFGQMRNADGIVVVVRAFATDRYAYDEPAADPARDLELVALEFLSADLEICERRLDRLADDWKNPKLRERAEKERATVQELARALEDGRGAWTVDVDDRLEPTIRGFQLLTRKPTVLLVNLEEEAGAPALDAHALDVAHRFDACLKLEADLAVLEGEERAQFEAEYGLAGPLRRRFNLACYRGLGLVSFFTVGDDEVKAWTIRDGDDAVTAAGKIHSDLARGFIRAEVVSYDDLYGFGSMREVKSKGKQRLEGKEYPVRDGDILNIRFSL